MSIFGRIPDVEKTMTSDIKRSGSTLVLVGQTSGGMGGSVYYDVAGGSSNVIPATDQEILPDVLSSVNQAITSGRVLSCHDVSEGGLITTVAEMCFGGNCGAELRLRTNVQTDEFLFRETAGCFVVEVENESLAEAIFGGVPHRVIGTTTDTGTITVSAKENFDIFSEELFTATTEDLKAAWQAPMKEVFPS